LGDQCDYRSPLGGGLPGFTVVGIGPDSLATGSKVKRREARETEGIAGQSPPPKSAPTEPRARLELSQFVHIILPVGECCSLSNTTWDIVKNIVRRRNELAEKLLPAVFQRAFIVAAGMNGAPAAWLP
jgi:hypothetical protein